MDWPQDVEAEQAVIGSVLIDEQTLNRAGLEVDDFFYARHKAIWKAFLGLRHKGEPIDQVTVSKAAKDIDFSYLTQCVTCLLYTSPSPRD